MIAVLIVASNGSHITLNNRGKTLYCKSNSGATNEVIKPSISKLTTSKWKALIFIYIDNMYNQSNRILTNQ